MTATVAVEAISVVGLFPHNIKISVHIDGSNGQVVDGIAGVYDGKNFFLDDMSKRQLYDSFHGHIATLAEIAVEQYLAK